MIEDNLNRNTFFVNKSLIKLGISNFNSESSKYF